MNLPLRKLVACAALSLTAGCTSTPMPEAFMSHFSSARQDEEHSKCMADHGMFNNRQLMVAPNAVESAWSYCIKKSDVWYPGKENAATAEAWNGR